jgi:apolipoprotein N-acyltransferase
MLLGVIFLILGVVLAFVWTAEFVVALKGALILSLFFWGLIAFLIGLSRRKGKRAMAQARQDETGDESQERA